uniref:SRCR domain-containing protein n=1 Tax=Esox lucius TaxID=8010 RepID=A0A6Q2XXE3_ESOLU
MHLLFEILSFLKHLNCCRSGVSKPFHGGPRVCRFWFSRTRITLALNYVSKQLGPQIRLVNGTGLCSGRVEVYYSGQWRTVCDDDWDMMDAEVVCRQLNCGSAVSAPGNGHFGQGSGPTWMDDVVCSGNESTLTQCPHNTTHNCKHGEDSGVFCLSGPQIRLVNGTGLCSGRVEVYYSGQWRTVCDDDWDMMDAEVVCRQLNCGSAVSAPGNGHFGQGSGPTWMDDVVCSGNESTLTQCPHNTTHNCKHGEDSGVFCLSGPQIRLVNGTGLCSGRVEVYYSGQWRTVCDDDWDMMDAEVVCRQLNCGSAVSAPGNGHFGQGSGPTWMDDVVCSGNESTLTQCPHNTTHNCKHGEDSGVFCLSGPQIRLVNGTGLCSGRVEVYYSGQWRTVCDDDWDMMDAEVVCRQLNCGSAVSAPGNGHFGQGSGPTWMDDVVCSGNESTLTQCPHNTTHNCKHGEDSGVFCLSAEEIRLVNGSSRCSGRVEVLYESQWGRVCGQNWDINDANVVCVQLGCGRAKSVLDSAQLGHRSGGGTTWLDNVGCRGNESYLTECSHGGLKHQDCFQAKDAIAVCSVKPSIRLVNGTDLCSGRVEVYQAGQWKNVCGDTWNLQYVNVVCRQLGCGKALWAPEKAYFGQGSGRSITQCSRTAQRTHECGHGNDADVVCSGKCRIYCLHFSYIRIWFENSEKCRNVSSMGQSWLVNGNDRCSGRVEVYNSDQWRRVSGDDWDDMELDAEVVCRQLNCGSAVSAPVNAFFGQGSGMISMDDVDDESDLSVGSGYGFEGEDGEDAGVVCSESPQIRLVNGTGLCSGRVEVYYSGQWRTVCDDDWDMMDAEVVCRQLNCGSAVRALENAHFSQGSGPTWMDDVGCSEGVNKMNLNCKTSPKSEIWIISGQIRLVSGTGLCSGRVEVYYSDQWGTVCDDDWDMKDAEVVCRQLNCGSAVSAPGNAHFGEGSEPTWMDNVGCSGGERDLTQCSHNGFGNENCGHGEDAGVVCSGKYLTQCSHNGFGKENCGHGEDAGVVCSGKCCTIFLRFSYS